MLLIVSMTAIVSPAWCWGFYGHRKINFMAVFLLPPEMMVLYKANIDFISEHGVDPDKRRYSIPEEAPRHYIDIDYYGKYPYKELPHSWKDAVEKFGEDTLQANGIVPWWVMIMQRRLTEAFKEKNQAKILRLSAEIGHYISDAHVPLHASSNHNGQLSNQLGIHAFWESRIPELFADNSYNFLVGKATYLSKPAEFIWDRVLESGAAADTVLMMEAALTKSFGPDRKFSFEERSGKVVRQYSSEFCQAYQDALKGMIERRMRQCIFAVASFWYTAWVDAGQPDLKNLTNKTFAPEEQKEFETLNLNWQNGKPLGKICD